MKNLELEAGLAALKQKNYQTAIAHFQTVCDLELHEPTVLKAQMNLVMAYQASGQYQKAMALCQTLTESENKKVRDWGKSTRDRLAQKNPGRSASSTPRQNISPTSKQTPSAPAPPNLVRSLDNLVTKKEPKTSSPKSPLPKTGTPRKVAQANDPTGFVPFDSSQQPAAESGVSPKSSLPKTASPKTGLPPKAAKANDPTGFVPFDSSPQPETESGVSPKSSLPKTSPKSSSPKGVKTNNNPTGFVPFDSSPQPGTESEVSPKSALPKSALPKSASPKSTLPKSTLPKSALPKSSLPKGVKTNNNPTGFVSFDSSQPGREIEGRASRRRIELPEEITLDEATELPEEINQEKVNLDRGMASGSEVESDSSSSGSSVPPINAPRVWRQAGRAGKWQAMKKAKLGRLRWVQAGTAIALFWVIRAFLQFWLLKTNEFLYNLPYIWPIQAFYSPQNWTLYSLVLSILLLCGSPWLMDSILRTYYGLDSFNVKALADRSPEATRLVRRFCFERSLPELTLGILPIDAPMAITYGGIPRFARIVVSRGLLEQLEEDEIAAIYAGELAHIINWDFGLMSVALILVQIPYLIYWQAAEVGSKWIQVRTWQGRLMTVGATIFSAVAYSFYWLVRWPALWLSRLRTYYSDRVAASLTGNPNGLIRALLKIAIGIAADIRENGETNKLLESLEMGLPLGHRQGTSLGSIPNPTPWEEVLAWDCHNPYRAWMTINNSHPPTGDRLYLLCAYAKFWKLAPELDLTRRGKSQSKKASQSNPSERLPFDLQRLFLQGAPFFGLPIGLAIGYAIWLVGAIAGTLGFWQLEWLWGDPWILMGCLPIGISLGIIIRSDRAFPEISPGSVPADPALPDLLATPSTLPIDSQSISISGKLLGRCGISNLLAQDLILDLPTGLVKLHCFSPLGLLGYFSPGQARPLDLIIGQKVAAVGWFRRGATPWLDVETLAAKEGKEVVKSDHRLWSTIVAILAAIWGAYLVSRGGILY